ncbi:MAG: hypothetical protein KKB03_00055 [Nanoarchaeota archaeon]|nr:hypothetical protein [Nanoarchaeota archaeon]
MKLYFSFFLLLVIGISCSTGVDPAITTIASVEYNCELALKELGSAQFAYQNANNNHDFGSWEALQKSGLVADFFTRSNIIEHYSLAVFHIGAPTGIDKSIFTIVAVPTANELRTFRIVEYTETPDFWTGNNEQWWDWVLKKYPRYPQFQELWKPMR